MLTPTIDTESRRKVGELLKQVDSLIKSEKFAQAREEVRRAKEIDPRNMYAQAYLERIESLLEQEKRNQEAAEAKKLVEKAALIKAEKERQRQEQEEAARHNALEEARKKNGEEQARQLDHIEKVSSYNRTLFEVWANGVPSQQQQQYLRELRLSLHISEQECSALELAVRRDCYVQAFRQLWSSEKGMEDGPSTITALRQRYQINLDEFDAVEVELLNQLKRPKTGPLIVVIDDDQEMLNVVSSILQEEGYDAKGFTTSDEAYRFLIHTTPEIILCDVNLETSTLGGFAFYEAIQGLPRLTHVPLVFMSGITDEIVIRTGKAMGADDFLSKPFDDEKLLSVVKGKIRRYRELRSISSN